MGGVGAVAALLLAGLHTPPARHFVLGEFSQILARQGIDFDASQLDYNLLGVRLELRNVRVKSRSAPDLPPVLLADRIWARLSLSQLVHGAYYLEDGGIDNPRVNVVVDRSGRDNLPHPPASNSSKSNVDYLLRHLLITAGELKFEDQRQQLIAYLPLERIAVSGSQPQHERVELQTRTGGQVSLATHRLELRATGAFAVDPDNLNVENLRVDAGASSVNLAGRINNLSSPSFDIHTEATLAVASLVEFAGVPQTVRGNLNVDLSAKGPLASLQATVRFHGEELTADRFDHLNIDAEATYDAAASRVVLRSARVTSPFARVHGDGDLALNPAAGESSVKLVVESGDMDRLSAMFALPIRVASTASGNIDAHWRALEFQNAVGTATLHLAAQRSVSKGAVGLDGTVRAIADGRLVTANLDGLKGLGTTASGRVVVADRKGLTGELHVASERLSTTIASAEVFLGKPAGTLLGTPIEGALSSTVSLSGTVNAPAAGVTLDVPNLSAGELRDIAVSAAASYVPDRVTIERAGIAWHGQTLNASGTVGLTGQQSLQVQATANQLSIAAVLAGLNRADVPVTGELDVAAKVGGTLNDPTADVKAQGRELVAYGETLGALEANGQFHGQELTVRDLKLEKPAGGGTLNASGMYNTASSAYRAEAHSRDFAITNFELNGEKLRGVATLDASGSGTVSDPAGELKLALDGIQLGAQEYGHVELNAKAVNHSVDVTAAAPKFHASASGKVGTQDPYPATVQLRLDGLTLAELPVKIDQPVEGSISAVIDASGDLQNYQKGTASAQVSALDLKWNGEPVRSEGPLAAHYAGGTLTIDHATLLAADSRVELSGSLPLDKPASAGELRLNAALNLPGLDRFLPASQKLGLQGTARAEGTIRGTLKRIDPDLNLSVTDASFGLPQSTIPSVTGANLTAHVRDGALEIDSASAKFGQAVLTASGTVPFALLPSDLPVELPRKQGPAQFVADMKGLDLGAFPGVPANVTGMVSAHVTAEADRPELGALKASLTFPELRASIDTYAIAQKETSEVLIENGVARIGHFQLSGPATEVELSGKVDLAGAQTLDLHLDGKLDAALASAFSTAFRARGATEIHAALSGPAAQPQVNGYLQMADGQFSIDQPRIGMEGVNLRVNFNGSQATLANLEGQINGGTLGGQGSVSYADGKVQNADLSIHADDLFLDFPAGLKTVSDVKLQLKSVQDRLALRGSVTVKEGGFTDDLNFDKGILAAVTAPRSLDLTETRNPLLDSIRLNVNVVTSDPIIVQNNLAKAEVSFQLVALGSIYEPGLAGRLTIEEGSEISLQERKYAVNRGIIAFTSDRRIEPNLDIEATTTASNYDITLRISGAPGATKTELTSSPTLPEPDIMAILVTGKTLDEIRGQEFQVAQAQVLSYLTGRVGASVGRELEKATGLSRVRVEPNLIAAEANPGARLTVGQDITRQLNLVYSMDLVNSSDQIYVAEYDLTKRFVTRGVRQSDGSYRFDFRHDLRFGGIPESQRTKQQTRHVGTLSVTSDKYFSEEAIRNRLKVKSGDRYDFFKLRRGMDRITSMYTKADLLESSVHLRREQKAGVVNLNLKIEPGIKVDFVFEGVSVPGHVEKDLRRVWLSGVFEAQRVEDATGVLRAWLIGENRLTAVVKPQVSSPTADRKRVLFDIQAGPKFEKVEWIFEGAQGLSEKELRSVVESQKLSTDVYTKPGRVTELLTQYYREMGFLDAVIGDPTYKLQPEARTGTVTFPVKEGPHYLVGEARFTGNHALSPAELAEAAPLPRGEGYKPVLRENALQRLREAYWAHGYNEVDVDAEVDRVPAASRVNLNFRIVENARSVVTEISVDGNRDTSENLIRSQLEIQPGDPVNLVKVGNSRRKLYNTGAYAMVDISQEDASPAADGTKQVRLKVHVQEIQPFELRYGGFYDTERGPGGIVDISNRNSLGSARVLGFRGRYDAQLQEARVYFSQPLLSRFPVKMIASPYIRREINPETDLTSGFNVDRLGFSIQQEINIQKHSILNWGYRIEKSRTYDTGPDPIFNVPLRLAFLTTTFSRDTRDDLLDATKGSFLSHALEFSPETLGSQVRFIKYFGQYFRYFPLQKPRVELFTNKVIRPRLVFATAARVGLSGGFGGQEVPLSERFFAGGGTTIRGFAQNSVGPATFTGTSLGGVGLLILNNEIRFPLIKYLDGAGFVDIGNVYGKLSEFTITDVRKAAGMGLRVRTPWFLLRLDYGFNLDRRTGEPSGRLFFSIGQAF